VREEILHMVGDWEVAAVDETPVATLSLKMTTFLAMPKPYQILVLPSDCFLSTYFLI